MPEKNDMPPSIMLDLNDKLEKLVDVLIPVRTLLVFISSLFTVILSFLLAFYFRHDFSFHSVEAPLIPKVLLLVIIVKMTIFFFFRLYEGMWRYVSISDMVKIFTANVIASFSLISGLYLWRADFAPGFSLNVLIIDFLLCFLAMSGKRIITACPFGG